MPKKIKKAIIELIVFGIMIMILNGCSFPEGKNKSLENKKISGGKFDNHKING